MEVFAVLEACPSRSVPILLDSTDLVSDLASRIGEAFGLEKGGYALKHMGEEVNEGSIEKLGLCQGDTFEVVESCRSRCMAELRQMGYGATEKDVHRLVDSMGTDSETHAVLAKMLCVNQSIAHAWYNKYSHTTLVHHFSKVGDVRCLALILSHRASPNACDRSRMTPLHFSAMSGCHQCCNLLLNYGACPRQTCDGGRTPAMLALQRSRFRAHEVLVKAEQCNK
eukprot:TRINITY_DN1739_c1_g1_i1.p1 TRINITY_DN1739_c1_g1~~TRINITY_DN1739_c1_g1_i1.p1  ORF type:complete len:225 (+),score=24.64 TRINITY_DN1739_c1_g1_i1:48-722(+)